MIKTKENSDVWLSGLARMKSANHEIENSGHAQQSSISTKGNEHPLQLYQQSILKHQAIDSMIDPDTFHCLNEWQEADPIADGLPPIFATPPQDANAIDNEMSHVNKI